MHDWGAKCWVFFVLIDVLLKCGGIHFPTHLPAVH